MEAREIQVADTETNLSKLLDDVERGATVVITRNGRAVARVVPEVDQRQARIKEAIEGLKALRRTMPKIPIEELLSMRDEGRR